MNDEMPVDIEVKDHLGKDVKTLCAYCGRQFEIDEVVIEKEIDGRTWKFCNESCLADFRDAYDFRDPEHLEEEGNQSVRIGQEEE